MASLIHTIQAQIKSKCFTQEYNNTFHCGVPGNMVSLNNFVVRNQYFKLQYTVAVTKKVLYHTVLQPYLGHT